MLFTLTDTDTTLEYHVTELTSQTFVFFIKDFRTYNDSTDFVAYEEFEYVYHLDKVNNWYLHFFEIMALVFAGAFFILKLIISLFLPPIYAH